MYCSMSVETLSRIQHQLQFEMMPFDLRVAYLDSSLQTASEVPLVLPSTQHPSINY